MADCWACQVESAVIRMPTRLGVVAEMCEPCARSYGCRQSRPPPNETSRPGRRPVSESPLSPQHNHQSKESDDE